VQSRSSHEEIERGKRAKALLEDPLLKEALDGLRAKWLQEIEATAPGDVEGRENLYFLLKAREEFERYLQIVVGRGTHADTYQEFNH